jgi:hypothetical protein
MCSPVRGDIRSGEFAFRAKTTLRMDIIFVAGIVAARVMQRGRRNLCAAIDRDKFLGTRSPRLDLCHLNFKWPPATVN